MAEGDGMTTEYVTVKVYARKEGVKLVELPDGAVGIINDEGDWVYGPLPIQWTKVMLRNTLREWEEKTWTQSGAEFMATAA